MKKDVVLESQVSAYSSIQQCRLDSVGGGPGGSFEGTTTRRVGWSWEGGPK